MSKLFDKYLILKKENPKKLYLFRCGKFYIFLDEDCDFINDYVVLKKTPFTNEVYKCGFPDQSLEDYMRVFSNLNLDVEVIEDENNKKTSALLSKRKHEDEILKKIKKLNLDNLTPMEALNFLNGIQNELNG